jgi:hypothetical protein
VGVVNLVGINGKIYSCICLKTLAFLLKILFFSTLDFCLGYDRFLFWISASCPVFVVASTGGAFISVSIFVPIGMFSVLLFTEKVNPFSHSLERSKFGFRSSFSVPAAHLGSVTDLFAVVLVF